MPSAAKSIEELFPLIEFCKAGNLSAVAKWIEEGKPLDPPEGKKTRRASPLQIAIEKGFLTLTEVLLDGGADPCANEGNALKVAVNHRRADIAALLLDRGVPLDSVGFQWVCYSADPDLINLFLKRGASPVDGHPFYHGFVHCLNPMLGAYKTQLEKFPELRIQADMALCHYAKEGNLRCVSLLLWAGARADAQIPEEEGGRNEYAGSCALEEAAYRGHLHILKKLKVASFPSMLTRLLEICSIMESKDAQEYLLGLIPKAGSLPDGGSSVLDQAFSRIGWAADPRGLCGVRSTYKIDECINAVELLCKNGLKWKPSPDSGRYNRSRFRHLEPDKILRVFKILKDYYAAETDVLEDLVATPTMKKHLGDYAKKITRLFHPPPLAVPKVAPPTIKATKVPDKTVKASIPELKAKAEGFILDSIRNIPVFHFWEDRVYQGLDNSEARRALGMSKDDERPYFPIFDEMAKRVNRQAKSYVVTVGGYENSGGVNGLTIALKEGNEWSDVMNEAWREQSVSNPRRISDPGMKILSWTKEHHSSTEWVRETSLSWKAGFNGRQGYVDQYLKELQEKIGSVFCYERRGERWSRDNPYEYRVWLDGEISIDTPLPIESAPHGLNPVFEGRLGKSSKQDRDKWCELIYDRLLESRPQGQEPFYILWINTGAELKRVFPNRVGWFTYGSSEIVKLITSLRLLPELEIAYDLSKESPVWYTLVTPQTDWATALKSIERLRNQPSLKVHYNLSDDASKLLGWIVELREEELLENWTPVVEDELEEMIGIECPWDDRNFSAYLQMLIDEINQKTDYDLRIQPWKDCSEWKSRIRVGKKKSDESVLIKQIQYFGIQKGKLLEEEKVRKLLSQIYE
jgi:hypothetical protein